jgi:hemoglobin
MNSPLVIGTSLFLGTIALWQLRGNCSSCGCSGGKKAAEAAPAKASIFDRIGGQKSVNAAVEIFYGKVIADPIVNGFFKNTDMKAQRAKQAKFLAFVMGGPEKWKGKSMLEAHKGMNLTDEHFGAIAGHLQSTLQELNVPADVIGEIMTIAASTHDDIVGH